MAGGLLGYGAVTVFPTSSVGFVRVGYRRVLVSSGLPTQALYVAVGGLTSDL